MSYGINIPMNTAFCLCGRYFKLGLYGLYCFMLLACQQTVISIDINNQPYLKAVLARSELAQSAAW